MQMTKKSRQILYVPYLFLEQRCASRRYLDMSVVTLGRANKAKPGWKVKKTCKWKTNWQQQFKTVL